MRRISLPNESEHGWQFNPELKEHVIEARLRRQEMMERGRREAVQSEPHRFKKGVLRLTEAELTAMRWEAELQFFNSARLSHELRDQREQFRENFEKRLHYFLKSGDKAIREVAELQAPLFARACGRAIEKATGHFADMLAQAVIARRGSKDFPLSLHAELWSACLDFAMSLAGYGTASMWVEKAWGDVTREHPLPNMTRLDTIEEQASQMGKYIDVFRPAFRRIVHDSPEWLAEAERKINLRRLLSNAPQRRANRPNGKSKRAIAMLLMASPNLSARQVCGKLDDRNEKSSDSAPFPKSWQPGVRLWIEAHDKFPKRVNTFISKVRKEAGIASHRDS